MNRDKMIRKIMKMFLEMYSNGNASSAMIEALMHVPDNDLIVLYDKLMDVEIVV